MTTERSAALAARDLRWAFDGSVHLPGDPAYDAGRETWNAAFDQRPALVAEAASAADVRSAVLTAWERDLPLAVQSTGHGARVPADGALLLKTSRMADVTVDPDRRIARVGAGARWCDVIAAAAPFGLAPLSGSSTSVGVAGYTLGGGLGWLSRTYGFAADALRHVNLVTADGRLVTAGASRNADLFWALRGGGGNFGIVTSLEFRLFPVARVYAGTTLFPIERAVEALAAYRDGVAQRPDELNVSIVLQRDALAIRGLYAGEPEDAVRALRPLFDAAGPPLQNGFRSIPYAGTGAIGGTAPRYFDLFAELPDAVLDLVVDAVSGPEPAANAVEVRHWGGAMARPAPGAGPVGHRHVPFSITVDGPAGAAGPLAPYATGGSFLNFLQDPTQVERAYAVEDYRRLRELKRTYDPENVFALGHNIPPARRTLPVERAA
jgi:hypothetical protein